MLARVEVWCIVPLRAVFTASHLKMVSRLAHRRDESGCSLPSRAGSTVCTAEPIDSEAVFGFLREPAPFDFDYGEALLTERLTGKRKTGLGR